MIGWLIVMGVLSAGVTVVLWAMDHTDELIRRADDDLVLRDWMDAASTRRPHKARNAGSSPADVLADIVFLASIKTEKW